MGFSRKQRDILAQFFCNYSIAWIAGGLIGPLMTDWNPANNISLIIATILSSGVSIAIMLYLVKEGKL